jgi:hypothetical protein
MRKLYVALLPLALAGAAAAQPVGEHPPTWTIQCVEVDGRLAPTVCDASASRLDKSEYICQCPNTGMRVKVPICQQGETQTPEGRKANRARRLAARDGSLIGDAFEGRPFCQAPRDQR